MIEHIIAHPVTFVRSLCCDSPAAAELPETITEENGERERVDAQGHDTSRKGTGC